MKKKVALLSVLALAAVLVSATLYAQPADPSGTWVNINDKTGKPEAELLVFKGSDGKIYGKILTVYGQDPATKCTACKGADYNQTVNGLVIVRGLVPDGDKWGGGYILDPADGTFYRCTMQRNGNKLDVRGYVGVSLFGRTQTWVQK